MSFLNLFYIAETISLWNLNTTLLMTLMKSPKSRFSYELQSWLVVSEYLSSTGGKGSKGVRESACVSVCVYESICFSKWLKTKV